MSLGLAVRIEDGIDLGLILEQSLIECAMSHKEASLTCSVDEASWSRMLRGERPMDLWKLRQLPLKVFQVFLPKLASALIQQWMRDLAIPYRMARAEIKEHEAKKERVS